MDSGGNVATPVTPTASKATVVRIPTLDPATLLDSLDKQRADGKQDFDAVAFLNKHYPSEAILTAQLPALREAVGERMEKLDDRISNALQLQSDTAESTKKQTQEAKASVVALERRIKSIKEKAAQSEGAVLEITKDIKRLDKAKKNLIGTISNLKRLHMLIHGVEQLRVSLQQQPHPDYTNAANLVDAIRLLLSHFEAYIQKIEPMKNLAVTVTELEKEFKVRVVRGFRLVAFGIERTQEIEKASKGRDKTKRLEPLDEDAEFMTVPYLKGGIMLIDAFGPSERNIFLHDFCREYLADYLKEFDPPSKEPKQERRVSSFKAVETKVDEGKPQSTLDQMEKRFIWFRELLKDIDEKFPGVFPASWNLEASMARYFLQLTREHILALLEGPRKDPDAGNATILLKALQKTIVFEKEISAWLQRERGTIFKDDDTKTTLDKGKTSEPGIDPLIGIGSVAFENYMDPYIELESQSMDEQLVEALEDQTVDTRGERPVFISSTNLFVYIKGSITRCTALTRGKAFFLLQRAFRDALKNYAQILDGKLPKATADAQNMTGALAIAASFGKKQDSSASSYRIPPGEEVTVCRVISTCEYCADTLEALEDLVKDTIDEKFRDKVDMLADQEAFHDVTAKAIRVLVSGLATRVENALKTLSAMNWGAWEAVGEESSYVRAIHEEVEPFLISVRELLPTSYFRSFCDKFATAFTSVYYDALTRLKRISEPGTQQLLLDVYNLKTLFMKLPVLDKHGISDKKSPASGTTIAPAIYTKMVQRHFGRIETMLKLVGTPDDLLVENFRVQWPDGGSNELATIMSLKGMKRNEQVGFLEKLGLDSSAALKGVAANVTSASIMSERVQALQDQGSSVAAKMNSDLSQMRQKVDDLRRVFR